MISSTLVLCELRIFNQPLARFRILVLCFAIVLAPNQHGKQSTRHLACYFLTFSFAGAFNQK